MAFGRYLVRKGEIANLLLDKEATVATDDVTERSIKCPCGKSTITITASSPDHPWARASQTNYSTTIDCSECSQNWVVYQESFNNQPAIVLRKELEIRNAARAKYQAASDAIKQSEQATRLLPKIVSSINDETSMAARHRKLTAFGLARESYGTYRKHPYGGEEAIRLIGGQSIAEIGSTDLGGEDRKYFSDAMAELSDLRKAEYAVSLNVVKLDG